MPRGQLNASFSKGVRELSKIDPLPRERYDQVSADLRIAQPSKVTFDGALHASTARVHCATAARMRGTVGVSSFSTGSESSDVSIVENSGTLGAAGMASAR